MYSTCLFCHSSLGSNESIEHFPIGRRLAFDAAKGRLWAVCSKCERWNLSPLEERWEAIEEAERAYRETKKRAATENIGLARLNDGTDVIRIGRPMLPEFAAWRYGDQLGKRTRQRVLGAAGALVIGGVVVGTAGAAVGMGALVMGLMGAQWGLSSWSDMHAATVRGENGIAYQLTRNEILWATMQVSVADGDLALRFIGDPVHARTLWEKLKPLRPSPGIPNPEGNRARIELKNAAANAALSALLLTFNGRASDSRVREAVTLVASSPSTTSLLWAIRSLPKQTLVDHRFPDGVTMRIGNIPKPHRLALEMSLHEADERRALEGELAELENRWKQAEEIAAIADGLTLPPSTDAQLDEMREKGASPE